MKRLIVLLLCIAVVFTLAACKNNNKTTPPTIVTDPSTGKPIAPIDPNDKYTISIEEFMQRLNTSGKENNFCLVVVETFEDEATSTLVMNDGKDKIYKRIIRNSADDGSFSLAEQKEQYFSYTDGVMYERENEDYKSQPYTFDTAPTDITIQSMIDELVCKDFYETLICNTIGFTYDLIKEEYHLVDFSMTVGDETRYFQNVTIKMSGRRLYSIECAAGTQKLYIEIANVDSTNITLPK